MWRTLEKVPDFLARVRQGQREETWTARQECRRYFGKPYGRGWALVGDAGYNRDPITAQGISDAFIDAEMLVEALSTFLSGDDTFELREIASAPGWQGYLSSAAKANARYGRAIEAWWVEGFTDLILRAVRGKNLLAHPRFRIQSPTTRMSARFLKGAQNKRAFEQQLDNWLAQRRKD